MSPLLPKAAEGSWSGSRRDTRAGRGSGGNADIPNPNIPAEPPALGIKTRVRDCSLQPLPPATPSCSHRTERNSAQLFLICCWSLRGEGEAARRAGDTAQSCRRDSKGHLGVAGDGAVGPAFHQRNNQRGDSGQVSTSLEWEHIYPPSL